ncbi:MAG: NAD+ synthase [Gammaproteobacteria bacterium]|jgi:NAD+ synthase (glutamine-hydrolysing)|nr:NAD+ synthase [Gammaproteobacteria bacterium]
MPGLPELRLALAQQDFPVGDVGGNTDKIIAVLRQVRQAQAADLVVFPELAMCGYPPEDLLFHAGLRRQVAEGLERICNESREIAALVGYPEYADDHIYNSVALFAGGRQIANYRKCHLPNYSVFDERRYFTPGAGPVVVEFRGVRLGLGICEDIWLPGLPARAAAAGAELLLVINGSPFETGKQAQREAVITARAVETGRPLVYLNLVGGQDELVFDGGSCVADAEGRIVFRAPAFAAGLHLLGFRRERDGQLAPVAGTVVPLLDDVPSVYAALLAGIRDYVRKNGFPGVVLGLSGGIDSALTLALAVDALGAMAVQAVMMPYHYTAAMSIEDAALQARQMGVDYQVVPIEAMVATTRNSLAPLFAGLPEDATEENIQSRCRGILLMAISNKTGRMVLATGNKSEMAVGYATLYGDMAGGYAPIKDCTKTLVYELARYRNSIGPVIPERVIDRPPSAELRPDQQDSDSLPPYPVLDAILEALIIENRSVDEIAAHGFDREVTARVLEMVRRAEYKRRQAPPGVRITGRAFGRDWRYPITSGYRHRP